MIKNPFKFIHGNRRKTTAYPDSKMGRQPNQLAYIRVRPVKAKARIGNHRLSQNFRRVVDGVLQRFNVGILDRKRQGREEQQKYNNRIFFAFFIENPLKHREPRNIGFWKRPCVEIVSRKTRFRVFVKFT
ncbi:MAG: hypothetical protein LBP29_01400 [Treponema sp.]|nr:hypothetical protein [Treponema sp.]